MLYSSTFTKQWFQRQLFIVFMAYNVKINTDKSFASSEVSGHKTFPVNGRSWPALEQHQANVFHIPYTPS